MSENEEVESIGWTEDDFKYTVKDMCVAHGVGNNPIALWTAKGAFPHSKIAGTKRNYFLYPTEAMRMLGGEIKQNMKDGKYPDSIFEIESKTNHVKNEVNFFNDINDKLDNMDIKLDMICEHLGIDVTATNEDPEHEPETSVAH